jgi:hypothetical protein
MRVRVACAVVAAAAVLCGAPAWAQDDCQVVGFSTTTTDGDAGVLGMTGLCQADFPGSRMCTTVEIAETRVLPSGLAGTAWVRPVYDGDGFESILGVKNEELACRGWGDDTSKGLTVDANGSFFHGTIPEGCGNLHAVSCCACSGSVVGGGDGEDALSCNTSTPIVYSTLGGKVSVTVEVRSGCPSGVDINLVDSKKGDVLTQNVPNGSIQILTLTPKSEEIQVVPATPEAGSFRVDFTVN